MQALYYSPTIWSNTDFYRTTGVLPFINHPELTLRDISHFGKVDENDLRGVSAMIIQRPGTPIGGELIRLAHRCGLKVILDYDDNVLEVDFLNPSYTQYQTQAPIIRQCIEEADEVWCSTQSVRDSIGKGIVIPNALNNYLLGDCAKFNTTSNKIVWRGGQSHEADVYENADHWVRVINEHPQYDFYFIGHRFTYLEQRCGDNYYTVECMPITTYFRYLRDLQPLAVIFPLCNTKLNKGKSNISWLEASWAGAAYFGNTMLPEFNKKGTLPIEQFESIVNNLDMLEIAHRTSVLEIKENSLLSKVNELRVSSLLNI